MENEMKKRLICRVLTGVFFIICSCAAPQMEVKPVTLERAPQQPQQITAETQAVKASEKGAGYELLKPPAFSKARTGKETSSERTDRS